MYGTGDDNVHFNNAEMLFNELIKYNKQFQMMNYQTGRTASRKVKGTNEHLSTLYKSI